jgi:2-polyprenyl-3-methyl-5-hydroxy-6-metoxy-1,4-benzoquinol methylase
MTNIINTIRESCVITNSKNLETLFTLENFPIYIGNTTEKEDTDLFSDMIFDISKECGVVQLKHTIDPNLIYSQYHSEAIGTTWDNHHNKFSELLSHYINENKIKNILEIGASNCRLANKILKENNIIKNWTVIEPNIPKQTQNTDERINFICDFFKSELIKEKYDLILHSHTLEHMYNPNNFLTEINESLKITGLHIFSVPNLFSYLEYNHLNILNFEHTIFLSEEIIDYLLLKNKFELVKKEKFEEHSIFYVTKKIDENTNPEVPNRYEKYKKMFLDYFQNNKKIINDINLILDNTNHDVYLFGGHIFSQFLISLGLKTEKIKFILDNSLLKHNTRLYGTNLIIKNPKKIEINDNSIIILKVGNYKNEIKSDLLKINQTLNFIE